MYVEQIGKLMARQQLMQFEAQTFLYMDENARKNIVKQYERLLDAQSSTRSSQRDINSNWDLLRKGIMPHD